MMHGFDCDEDQETAIDGWSAVPPAQINLDGTISTSPCPRLFVKIEYDFEKEIISQFFSVWIVYVGWVA